MSETWEKRQRQKSKRERKEAKRAQRDEKREPGAEAEEGPSNDELIARFAALNREHGSGAMDEDEFVKQRNEIWKLMGLPVD